MFKRNALTRRFSLAVVFLLCNLLTAIPHSNASTLGIGSVPKSISPTLTQQKITFTQPSVANSLAGLVFTNATVFSSGAPSFDASAGTLDYRVAVTHLKPDGSDMTGTYDLVLNSAVARYLYGFTNAPIGATVSVVNNEGGS